MLYFKFYVNYLFNLMFNPFLEFKNSITPKLIKFFN